jgi:anti-sigma factor RsiW
MKNGAFILDDIPQELIERLLAYLDRELSAEEREKFEQRLLTDEQFSSQVESARILLLVSYANGSLEPAIESRMRNWVATSPSAQKEVAIEKALRRIATRRAPSRRLPWSLWALVPLAACLLIAIFFPALRNRQAPGPVVTTARNHPSPTIAMPQAEQTILLVAQRLRGNSPAPAEYHLYSGKPVRLQIVLPPSHSAKEYDVTLKRGSTSSSVVQFTKIPVQGTLPMPFLEIRLPEGALPVGSYSVAVTAPNDSLGDSFRLRFRILE